MYDVIYEMIYDEREVDRTLTLKALRQDHTLTKQTDENGLTLLHHAAITDWPWLAETLLQHGASLEIKNFQEYLGLKMATPLLMAAFYGSIETLRVFLTQLQKQLKINKTAVSYQLAHNSFGYTALHCAVTQRRNRCLLAMLESKLFDIEQEVESNELNNCPSGTTLLSLSIISENSTALQLICNHYPDSSLELSEAFISSYNQQSNKQQLSRHATLLNLLISEYMKQPDIFPLELSSLVVSLMNHIPRTEIRINQLCNLFIQLTSCNELNFLRNNSRLEQVLVTIIDYHWASFRQMGHLQLNYFSWLLRTLPLDSSGNTLGHYTAAANWPKLWSCLVLKQAANLTCCNWHNMSVWLYGCYYSSYEFLAISNPIDDRIPQPVSQAGEKHLSKTTRFAHSGSHDNS